MTGFDSLRERLLSDLRHRIRNGELTERGLALRAGISQPHLHNILKGIRRLNPGMADQLLMKLGIGVLDLFESDELRHALFVRARDSELSIEVPVLKARLGPELPWSNLPSAFETVKVPSRGAAHIARPVVARLADDPAMSPVLSAGDLVLLDSSPRAVACIDPDALFAVELGGGTAIRWIRRGRHGLYVVSEVIRGRPLEWQPSAARAVRALAIPLRWLHKPEVLYDPLLPRGTRRGPLPQSAAS